MHSQPSKNYLRQDTEAARIMNERYAAGKRLFPEGADYKATEERVAEQLNVDGDLTKEERKLLFGHLYGGAKLSDVTYEKPSFPHLEEIKMGETISLTIHSTPKCLHCSKVATASCLVEDAEMVLQLTCHDHIRGEVLWRKED